jgi:D-tyrosyl-tRNA(Tyr) deacylase
VAGGVYTDDRALSLRNERQSRDLSHRSFCVAGTHHGPLHSWFCTCTLPPPPPLSLSFSLFSPLHPSISRRASNGGKPCAIPHVDAAANLSISEGGGDALVADGVYTDDRALSLRNERQSRDLSHRSFCVAGTHHGPLQSWFCTCTHLSLVTGAGGDNGTGKT